VLPEPVLGRIRGGRASIVGPCTAPLDVRGVLPAPDDGETRHPPGCARLLVVEATDGATPMFAMIMKPRRGNTPPVVDKIVIMDDEYAKEGFDVTDAIKRPDILLGQAEDHLSLLQDVIRGEPA
jgi:hypothetical protein